MFCCQHGSEAERHRVQAIFPELRETKELYPISSSEQDCIKTLGLVWNTSTDAFHLTISELDSVDSVTKRSLVSDIAKIFDALGWFAPAVISMKILLQRVWEEGV